MEYNSIKTFIDRQIMFVHNENSQLTDRYDQRESELREANDSIIYALQQVLDFISIEERNKNGN